MRQRKSERPQQHYFAKGCPFQIRFSAKNEQLVITKVCLEHNHPISEQLYKHYPKNRHESISKKQQEQILNLMQAEVPYDSIRTLIPELNFTNKDLHNMKPAVRSEEDCSAEGMVEILKSIANEGGNVEIQYSHQDNMTGEINGFIYQTLKMRTTFTLVPEVLFIDSTYKVTLEKWPMVTLLAHGAKGRGEPIAHMFVQKESISQMKPLLQKLVMWNPGPTAQISVIVMDKESGFISMAEDVFPRATIQLCRFHVAKYLREYCRKQRLDKNTTSVLEHTFGT